MRSPWYAPLWLGKNASIRPHRGSIRSGRRTKGLPVKWRCTSQNLQLILPDGQLLAKVCRANPGASVAEVAQSSSQTCHSNSFWTTAQIGQALKSKKLKGSGAAADWMVCLIWIWLCLKIGIHPTPLVDHHLPIEKMSIWEYIPFSGTPLLKSSTIPLVLVDIYVLGFEKDLFVGGWTSRYN